MEPKHGSAPIVIDETPGKKAYCQCGHSASLPYCDGAHARNATGVVPIVHEIMSPGKRAICQCHRSGDKPWCDGSHKHT